MGTVGTVVVLRTAVAVSTVVVAVAHPATRWTAVAAVVAALQGLLAVGRDWCGALFVEWSLLMQHVCVVVAIVLGHVLWIVGRPFLGLPRVSSGHPRGLASWCFIRV
jgi:hypothetical protein